MLLSLVLGTLSSCRSSQPPTLSLICIGDGFGGADCVNETGAKVYKAPSELKNFWMTTEVDQQNFSAWCYDTSPAITEQAMINIAKVAR